MNRPPRQNLRKQQVRELAAQADFPNHKKKDSTGICFIGERRFRDFLSDYLPANPGEIQTVEGQCIGRHQGLMYYTLGQRQGLGIGGVPGAPEAPWFVIQKDLEHNVLIVAQGHDHPLLLSSSLLAEQLHWVAGAAPAGQFSCLARCRHRQPLQECEVVLQGQGMQLSFRKPQRAVTPGQSVVLYLDGACLGGGIIVSGAQ